MSSEPAKLDETLDAPVYQPPKQLDGGPRGRWARWAGLILVVLGLVQFDTYLGCAGATMPAAAITHLADFHCIRGCEYAAIDQATWETLNSGQRRAIEDRVRRYVSTIYHSNSEIPDSGKQFLPLTEKGRKDCEDWMKSPGVAPETREALRKALESGQQEVGLNRGIRLSWKLESRGLFWMRSTSGCYMSIQGSEYRSDLYVWVLYRWVPIRNYSHVMA